MVKDQHVIKSPTKRPRSKEPEALMPRSVRMPLDVHAAVQRAAAAEGRTITSLLIYVIRTWLVQHGYLPKPAGQPKPRRPKT
jgi:hypothetical protein